MDLVLGAAVTLTLVVIVWSASSPSGPKSGQDTLDAGLARGLVLAYEDRPPALRRNDRRVLRDIRKEAERGETELYLWKYDNHLLQVLKERGFSVEYENDEWSDGYWVRW